MKQKNKNLIFQWCLFLLILSLPISSTMAKETAEVLTKEFNESFRASSGDILNIENTFGNITVSYWDKKDASIRVVVESTAKNRNRAQEALDRVSITIRKSGNKISASTSYKSSNSNNNNEKLEVNYFISIPSEMEMDLEQRYGTIYLPDNNSGKCDLKVQFGNLKAGNFTNAVKINGKYSNLAIENLYNANIDVQFCNNVSFENANKLVIKSQYSTIKGKNVKDMDLDIGFGKCKIKKAEMIKLNSSYSDLEVEYLQNEIDVRKLGFGKLIIKQLSKDFTSFNVSANYGNVTVSIPSSTVFSVDAQSMQYGKFRMKDGFTITSTDIDSKKHYRYDINGGSSSRKISFHGNSFSNLEIKPL